MACIASDPWLYPLKPSCPAGPSWIVQRKERMRGLAFITITIYIYIYMHVRVCALWCAAAFRRGECSCECLRQKENPEDWQLSQSLHAGLNARLVQSGSGSSGCLLPFDTQWLLIPATVLVNYFGGQAALPLPLPRPGLHAFWSAVFFLVFGMLLICLYLETRCL